MPLSDYRRKRRNADPSDEGSAFVIQHHAARSDHFDFHLEIGGVLVSWSIPQGPSTNPRDRRMARRTGDHPLEYGAGEVIVWDRGNYANATKYAMAKCLDRGHLSFHLHGEKLSGGFALTRIREGKDETWLLVKRRDEDADAAQTGARSGARSAARRAGSRWA